MSRQRHWNPRGRRASWRASSVADATEPVRPPHPWTKVHGYHPLSLTRQLLARCHPPCRHLAEPGNLTESDHQDHWNRWQPDDRAPGNGPGCLRHPGGWDLSQTALRARDLLLIFCSLGSIYIVAAATCRHVTATKSDKAGHAFYKATSY